MRITRELLLTQPGTLPPGNYRRSLHHSCIPDRFPFNGKTPFGGTTDVDLVFIHDNIPPLQREMHRFTDEISLDLYHHEQAKYDQPRHLRADPFLGPIVNGTRLILHDTLHSFEYTQAIVIAQFDRPDHRAERVSKLAANARADWWRLEGKETLNPKDMAVFINSSEKAANALAS